MEELLDFSRIQDGRMKMNFQRLDVNREAADTAEMFAERCAAEKRKLTLIPSEAPAMVFADRNRLRQVMVNVIDTAIKYTDEQGEISVRVTAVDDRVTVTVADNGCGIPREDLPLVTRRFYKANNRRSGFGIGLAVVEEIMTMHQGSMAIHSTEGRGTTVALQFPEASRFRRESTEQHTLTE